jgi:hypothetical protein
MLRLPLKPSNGTRASPTASVSGRQHVDLRVDASVDANVGPDIEERRDSCFIILQDRGLSQPDFL